MRGGSLIDIFKTVTAHSARKSINKRLERDFAGPRAVVARVCMHIIIRIIAGLDDLKCTPRPAEQKINSAKRHKLGLKG